MKVALDSFTEESQVGEQLNYAVINAKTDSDHDHRVHRLVVLAKALANEIETLKQQFSTTPIHSPEKAFSSENKGIDFYKEVERYEIDLIRRALEQCGGNQSRAAKLLHMKSTTLHAKMKNYGLNSNPRPR